MQGIGEGGYGRDRGLRESYAETVAGPAKEDEENAAGKECADDGQQSHTPDLVGVEREQAGGTNEEQQRSYGAQGNQKSIGRQDEAAELEEMRVHRGGL